MTPEQKATAQAIVNLFETGRAEGRYGQVTVLRGDSGHLTYGRSQTTLASGNLSKLIREYCAERDAIYGGSLRPYLDRLAAKDTRLDNDPQLHRILRSAGDDPVMKRVQDAFFDRTYWQTAVNSAAAAVLTEPLSITIVYDSVVHGSWVKMRDRTIGKYGTPKSFGERAWIARYIEIRRGWLLGMPAPLPATVYRMDELKKLVIAGNWSLALPIVVRGVKIGQDEALGARPVLRLGDAGMAVKELQNILKARGHAIVADGTFGPRTEAAVKTLQAAKGLTVDGVVGAATWTVLDG